MICRTIGCSNTLRAYERKCQECKDIRFRDYQNRARYKPKEYVRASTYGLSVLELSKLIEDAQGICKICEEFFGDRLQIDHCHNYGKVRGMVCRGCNRYIETSSHIPRIALYLQSSSCCEEHI